MQLTTWIDQYGYFVLFIGLMLELVALPVPGEVLMSYSGLLVSQGKLGWIMSILSADIGSSVGITLAYFIGYKLGAPFFRKHGHRVHLTPERLDKTSQWFEKYGNKMLIIGYFIPGVRHITGYFSGMIRIPYRAFALYAYIGAFLWTGCFITLGKILGPKWDVFQGAVKKYLIIGGILAVILFLAVYLYRTKKQQILDGFISVLIKLLETFHSFGKVKLLVGFSSAFFLFFFILMLGLIQDFLANEFALFDEVATFIIQHTFTPDWIPFMKWVSGMTSPMVFIPIVIVTTIWILLKGKNRGLEVGFLFLVSLGGEMLEEGLRRIFHRVGPEGLHVIGNGPLPYTFPSEQSLIAITVFGFVTFLLIRHVKNKWIHATIPWTVVLLALLVGISRVYLGVQFPSDVFAGYVFGGVWLSLNIVLLEVFRHLKLLKF